MHLRRYLVAGLLVWLPIGVTILVFKVLLDLMDAVLFLVPLAYRPETWLGFRLPGLGALSTAKSAGRPAVFVPACTVA